MVELLSCDSKIYYNTFFHSKDVLLLRKKLRKWKRSSLQRASSQGRLHLRERLERELQQDAEDILSFLKPFLGPLLSGGEEDMLVWQEFGIVNIDSRTVTGQVDLNWC